MKRYLSGLLCILLVLIGTTAIAKVLKGPLVILKAMSAADASTIAVANGMGVYYTDSTNGRAYFVSAAGVAYDLTETGGSSGGAGTTWFYTDGSGVQLVTAGGTQYYRGVSGVSTSGSGATIYIGVDSTIATMANLALYTSYAQLHTVSGYATDTGVSTFVTSQISGVSKDITARTAPEAFTGATGFALQSGLAAAGAPGTTSGVSLWGGVTPYIVDASGISSVTQWIAAGTSQYQPASGITPLMVAGTSQFVTKASFATQTDALSTSGASLWSGASTYIINAAATGVSSFTGANLSANQNAVAIAVQFSTSGDSTFVVAPWTFVVSGVSLMNASLGTGVAGASIFLNGSATASYNISGSGSTTYNVTATGRITAGTVLLFSIGTIPTGQTLIEQLFGRKE